MTKQLSDTNPKVEKYLIDLIRKSSIQQRLSKLESLSSLTLQLSKRALARANPNMSKRELDLLFVKYYYGEDLYNKVNQFFQKMKYEEK